MYIKFAMGILSCRLVLQRSATKADPSALAIYPAGFGNNLLVKKR